MTVSVKSEDASTRCQTNLDELRRLIDHVAHLLPTQGPISVFVHHNTLHPFESLKFEDAVKRGSQAYGCQPYLSEERYHQSLASGRIQASALKALVQKDLGEDAGRLVGPSGTLLDLRLAMLQHPLHSAPDVELRWLMAESDGLRRFRPEVSLERQVRSVQDTRHWVMRDLREGKESADRREQAIQQMVQSLMRRFERQSPEHWSPSQWEAFTLNLLWQICRQGVHALPSPPRGQLGRQRHRDLLFTATQVDADELVHELLTRFTASFLDQGLAVLPLPGREQGFYASFTSMYQRRVGPPDSWKRQLAKELRRISNAHLSPLELIAESLAALGVEPDEWEAFLADTLLALRGWGGMLVQMETNAEWTRNPAPPGSLIEFLAVRLLLDRLALEHIAAEFLGYRGALKDLRHHLSHRNEQSTATHTNQRAFQIFQLAQLQSWRPEDLYRLSKTQWLQLVQEIESFSGIERRRLLHQAYELNYRQGVLDAFAAHRPARKTWDDRPCFQFITCIDDREESLRRHLEEVCPRCETFAVAGFFAVPMYYRGIADAHYIPLCPNVIKPQHFVQEDVAYTYALEHQRRAKTRWALGAAAHRFHLGSRSFIGGAVAAIVGSLASFPLVARVLFPRLTSRIRRHVGRLVEPPHLTHLDLHRLKSPPSTDEGHRGFTLEEMATIVDRLLRDIGLTKHFSDLLIITGHGSSSLNNPHESAYNCGACGGGRGGPNARAFAMMANDPRVRRILSQNGLDLPSDLYVVGAYHNTCDDSVIYHDLDRLPISHRKQFEFAREAIEQARERNAHERIRRFESAPLNLSTEGALRHVEERSEDLSQARPEYNHATCAACFVGRRERTRGLFLDRRCFLASYDPTQDDEHHSILARILGAVIPVCAGISLEYYFSCVDPSGWGCGSKLPHNITSLLGVMEGAASDLRTGLSQQMVEIHEPLRILFTIETTPAGMTQVIAGNATIRELCCNQWVQLAVLDPHSQKIHLFQDNQFVEYTPTTSTLPVVARSIDWYRGWRDHLGFAEVRASLTEMENTFEQAPQAGDQTSWT